jgi:hypothetical protein
MQRPKRHQGNRRGAVRIGDYPVVIAQRLGIDLRDHKRNGRIHPKCRTLVHDEASGAYGIRSEFTGDRALRGKKGDVQFPKNPFFRLFNRITMARAIDDLPHRPGGGEKPQPGHREVTFMQKAQQFLTDSAGGTDNADCE